MPPARRSDLLALCRSLPGTTEDIKWGNDLVFSVGKKMYAGFYAAGTDATFGCKVDEHDFASITEIEGIRPAPYAARYHWISVEDPKVLPAEEAKALIRRSYELVKGKLPAKTQRQIDAKKASPKKASPKKTTPKKATSKKR